MGGPFSSDESFYWEKNDLAGGILLLVGVIVLVRGCALLAKEKLEESPCPSGEVCTRASEEGRPPPKGGMLLGGVVLLSLDDLLLGGELLG